MTFFSRNFVHEIPLAIISIVVALIGLWISNIVYDHGVPNYLSRKIGHLAGGIAFLCAYFLSGPGWAVIIALTFFEAAIYFMPSLYNNKLLFLFSIVSQNKLPTTVGVFTYFNFVALPLEGEKERGRENFIPRPHGRGIK
jgi:hypothetical protein